MRIKGTPLIFVLFGLLLSFPAAPAAAKTRAIESAGTAIAIGLPIAAGGISLLHNEDWDGVYELGASTALTVGTALILKQIVREQRPDHSDFQSFPSDTAAVAYSSADYLWGRYGWEWGVPAYAAAMFVGYSRVDAKKHHWYDVAASSAIAFAFNYAVVTRYRGNDRYGLYASADSDSVGLHFEAHF